MFSYRAYTYGKSTLQGGSVGVDQIAVQQQIVAFQSPDFELESKGSIITNIFPAFLQFGAWESGGDVVAWYGQQLPFNVVKVDPFGIVNGTQTIAGEYFSVDLTRAYGLKDGIPWDARAGHFRIGAELRLNQGTDPEQINASGGRIAAIVCRIQSDDYSIQKERVIWQQAVVPPLVQDFSMQVETQRIEWNLLEYRREVVADYNDTNVGTEGFTPFKAADCSIHLSFRIHQSSDSDTPFLGAKIWVKQVGFGSDPGMFKD